MDVATSAFDRLATKHGERLEAEFKAVPGFEVKPLALARQVLRLGALLHDVGHAAFSHAAESVVHKDLGHEALSIQLITSEEHLAPAIAARFGSDFAPRVAAILTGAPALPPQLQVLKDVVSGEMDADRTDYLIRDSYHCGVDYGRFEYRRLIESITLDDGSGRLELALHRDGIHAFEALILARYQMSTQVYYHRLRRVYDRYLVQYHEALGPDAFDSVAKIVAQNDMTMMARIMADARGDGPQTPWARRIIERRHHRLVFEPGMHVVGGHDLSAAHGVAAALREKFSDMDLLVDIPTKAITIHKLLLANDNEGAGVDMMLVSDRHGRKPIARSSQVFSTLPRTFRPIRIFADVAASTRDEMRTFAEMKWIQLGGTT